MGARRRRARPRVVPEDDRPRGFQPQRMRRLWRDIDDARDQLGLDETRAPRAPWSITALIGCASDLTASVSGVVGGLATVPREIVRAAPTVVSATLDVAPWLRQVPVLGRLLALLPGE